MERKPNLIIVIALAAMLLVGSIAVVADQPNDEDLDVEFEDDEDSDDESDEDDELDIDDITSEFHLDDCRFRTRGDNLYFPFHPGYQLTLEGEEDGNHIKAQITVLRDREALYKKNKGTSSIRARVVEEREWENGELVEVSRNYWALCKETGDIFYFGEEVNDYEDGEIVSHDGAWRADERGNSPGIIVPGRFMLGALYFQEIAPDVAMDFAENDEMGLTVETEAGTFKDCVRVEEGTTLDPEETSEKVYCPGIGLVQDDVLELVDYGYVRVR